MSSVRRWNPGRIEIDRGFEGPKYAAIARALGDAISGGDLAPGEALPSQRELADAFGVTVMTVRQAIARLVEQGVVAAEQGRGTFVSAPRFNLSLGPLGSLAEEVRAAGRELETKVLSHGPVLISTVEMKRMQVRSDKAYEVVRLRLLDGDPLVLQVSLLPEPVGRRLDPAALSEQSLYDQLATTGTGVDHATETVQAVSLDAPSARTLGRRKGEAALLSCRMTSAGGRLVVDDRALIPGDLVVIRAERHTRDHAPPFVLGMQHGSVVPGPFVRSVP